MYALRTLVKLFRQTGARGALFASPQSVVRPLRWSLSGGTDKVVEPTLVLFGDFEVDTDWLRPGPRREPRENGEGVFK